MSGKLCAETEERATAQVGIAYCRLWVNTSANHVLAMVQRVLLSVLAATLL